MITVLAGTQRPKTESIGNGLSRTLTDTPIIFRYKSVVYKIVIPAGFVFDGASIPRITWTLLGLTPHGDMDGPALPHDYIYHHQGKLPQGAFYFKFEGRWIMCFDPITRSISDELLEALCEFFEVAGSIKTWAIWAGVRIGGWLAWRRDDVARKISLASG